MRKTVIEIITELRLKHNSPLTSEQIAKRLNASASEWSERIIKEAKQDALDADFFNQIDSGTVPALSKQAFKISFTHGCLQWAKYILEIK